MDIVLAYFFNSWICNYECLRIPCALLNSKGADYLYDGIMLLFFVLHILSGRKKEGLQRGAHALLIFFFLFFCYYFWTRMFFGRWVLIDSPSPAVILSDLFLLSSCIDWIKIKECAAHSYPGGHALTIFLFIGTVFHAMGPKVALLASLVSLPFLLPRLMVGAHWTSDLLLGSLPLALFNLSWFIYTIKYGFRRKKVQNTLYSP